jgi:hypothetical protein
MDLPNHHAETGQAAHRAAGTCFIVVLYRGFGMFQSRRKAVNESKLTPRWSNQPKACQQAIDFTGEML